MKFLLPSVKVISLTLYFAIYLSLSFRINLKTNQHSHLCNGYSVDGSSINHREYPTLSKLRKKFKKSVSSLFNRSRFGNNKGIGKLILIRHGESEMNVKASFTGWIDSDITEEGKREMEHAGRLLLERGYVDIDLVYTSVLKRSIRSSWVVARELNQIFRPVIKSWRLNQRVYGAMEGISKYALVQEIGEEKIAEYRKSLYLRPPPMTSDHPYWHRNERKYEDINPDDIPLTESIADCFERVKPLYENDICQKLKDGKNILVIAHANSLKGIIKLVDSLSNEDIQNIELPNGSPLVYQFDKNMKPIHTEASFSPMNGYFIEDPIVLQIMLEKEKKWGSPDGTIYQGMYSLIDYSQSSLITPIMYGLARLNQEREAIEQNYEQIIKENSSISNKYSKYVKDIKVTSSPVLNNNKTKLKKIYKSAIEEPFVVLIRHGKTEYNKLGIFTGWDDAPLAEEGRLGAIKAGQILKMHGIEFDVVYTSWLSRAIETAWLIVDQLDLLWLPIIKSWRLNERMYGLLTGTNTYCYL